MSLLSRNRPALAFALSLVVLALVLVGKADAQAKFKKDNVTFRTVDAVDLKGTYWTPSNAKKNACVLLLHNFSKQKGGNRNDDGWDALGDELAGEGYTVLSFDFRGHGESKGVGKEFWDISKFPRNALARKAGGAALKDFPTAIDHKDFQTTPQSYYPALADDISAAKAYLNNKAGAASGNVIVVGAGQGATLGAMWMAAEWRLYRDKTENANVAARPMLDSDPEGKDLVCGVWLTIGDSLETHTVPVANWLEEVGGKKNKLPMLFVYGKDDARNKQRAQNALQRLIPGYKLMESGKGDNPDPKFKFTRDFAIEGTKLDGSQLLQNALTTTSIIKFYANSVMDDRGSKETKRHDMEKYRFYWVAPGTLQPKLAKMAGEEFLRPIDPASMGILR